MADNQINFSMDFGDSFKSLNELKNKIVEVQEAMKRASDPKVLKTLGDGLEVLTKQMRDFKTEIISMSTVLKNADKNVFSKMGQGLASGFNLAIQSVNAMSNSTENLVNLLKQAQGIAASTQMNTAMGSGSTTRPNNNNNPINTPDETSTLFANATAYQKLQKEFKLYHDAILNARTELEILRFDTKDFTTATEKETARMRELNKVIDDTTVKMNKVNGPLRSVEKQMGGSNISPYKNELFSLQQVFREIPAFAYGAQTGLMALSNNLPILADDFMKVANATKTAEGGTANYGAALKTFVGGLFSWQTAMVAGVTILTMYGAEIWDAITGTKTLTEEQKKQAEAIRNTTLAYDKQIGEVEYYNSVLQAGSITEQQQIDLLHQIEELTGVDLTASYDSMTESIKAADMATKYHIDTIREEIILQTNKQKIIDGVSSSEDAYRKSLEAGKDLTGKKAKDFAKLKAEMDTMTKSQLELIANNQYMDDQFGKGTDAYALLRSTFTDLGRESEKYAEALVQQKTAEEELQKLQSRSIELIKKQKGSLDEKEKSAAITAKSVKQNAEYELGTYGKLVTTQKELNIQLTGGLTDENKKRLDIAATQYEIRLNQEILHNENIRREKLKAKAVELKIEKVNTGNVGKLKKDFSIDELKTLKDMNVISKSSYDLLSKSYIESEKGANKAKTAFAALRTELKGIGGSILEAFGGTGNIVDNVKNGGKKPPTKPGTKPPLLFMKPGAKTEVEKENIRLTERLKELQAQLNTTLLKGDDNTNKVRINKRKLFNDETLSLEKMLIQDLDALEELRVKLLNSSFEKEILLVEEKYDTLIRKANERYDSEMEILRKIFDAKQENIDQEEQWQTLLDSAKTQKAYDANFVKYQAFRKQQDTKFESFTVTDSQGVRALDLLTKQITNLNKNMQKELTAASKKATLDRYNFEKDFNKKLFLENLVEDNAVSLELRKQQEENFTKDLEEINKQREFQYRESMKEYVGLSGTAYNIKDLEKYKKDLEALISSDPASSMVGELGLAIKALEGNLLDFKNVWDEGQQSYDKFYRDFLAKDTSNQEAVKKIKERAAKLKKAEDDFYNSEKGLPEVNALQKEWEDIRQKQKDLEKEKEVSQNQAKDARREIEKLKKDKEGLDKPGIYEKLFDSEKVEKYKNKVFSLNTQINEMIKIENNALKDKLELQKKIDALDEKEKDRFERQSKLVSESIKQSKAFEEKYKKDVANINKETNDAIEADKKLTKSFDEKTKGLNKSYLRFREILETIPKTISETTEGANGEMSLTIIPEPDAVRFKKAFKQLIEELKNENPKVDVAIVPQVQKTGSKAGITDDIKTTAPNAGFSPTPVFRKEDIKQLTPAEKEALRLKAEERVKQYLLEEERMYQKLLGQGFGEVLSGKNATNAGNREKLEKFKKQLSEATDPKEVKRLKEEIKELNKEIEKLDRKGPSSVTSNVTLDKDKSGALVYDQESKPKKGTEEYKADKQKVKQLNKEWQNQDKFNREIERQTFEHEKRVYLLKKDSNMVTEQDTIDMHFKEIEMLKKKREWYDEDFKKYADAAIKMVDSVYSVYEAYTNGAMQIANDRMALQDQLTNNILSNYDREIAKINDMMATQKMSDAERVNSEQKVMDITNERALVEKNQKIASLELQKRQIEVNKKMALAQAAIAGGIAIANVVQMATKSGAVAAAGGPFVFAATLAAGLASVAGAMMSANTAIKSSELQTQTVDAEIAGIESAYLDGLNKGKSVTSQQQNGPAAPLTTFNKDLVNQGQASANYSVNDTLGGYKIYVTQADIQNANNQTSKIKKKVTFG